MRGRSLILGLAVAALSAQASAQDRADTYSFRHSGVDTQCTIARQDNITTRTIVYIYGRGSSSVDRRPSDAAWRASGCAAYIDQAENGDLSGIGRATPLRWSDLQLRTDDLGCRGGNATACQRLVDHYAALCRAEPATEDTVMACATMQSYRARANIAQGRGS